MSKIFSMARVSARGGLSLFLGQSLSTIISAVGAILLVRLLVPSEYGLMSIALIFPWTVASFRDMGINLAMVKYLAQYKTESRTGEIRNILASCALINIIIGATLSLISFSLAGFLASNVFYRPEIKPLIEIASLIVLSGSLLTTAQATFTGFERMEFNSIIMILQSSLKTGLEILLVILGYGVLGAVFGHAISLLVTGMIGISLFYLFFYRNYKTDRNKLDLRGTLRTLLMYGLPLYLSTILIGLLTQFYNFMIAIYCNDFIIGNYKAAVNFSVIITFFTTPIGAVLFLAFSKLNREKENKNLGIVFRSSVKYATLLVIPVTTAIMVLSEPLTFTLFGKNYRYSPLFLSLIAVGYLYTGLGSLSLGNFLNGQGETKVNMKLTLITLATGLPLSLVLIPTFGILGLIATTLTAVIPYLIVGLWWVRKHYGVTVDWASSTKTYLASGVAAGITYITLFRLSFYEIELMVGGIVFMTVYIVTAPLTGAVNKTDIDNLREMLGNVRPIYFLFNLPLKLIEKILALKESIAS